MCASFLRSGANRRTAHVLGKLGDDSTQVTTAWGALRTVFEYEALLIRAVKGTYKLACQGPGLVVSVVHLEDGFEHFPVVKELVVFGSVFDGASVLNKASKQIVVLGEKFDCGVKDGTNGASAELEAEVLVVQIRALERDRVGVNTAGRDDTKVTNDLNGEVKRGFGTDDFESDIGATTLRGVFEHLDGIVVGEVERNGAVLLGFGETIGNRVDSVDRLEEGACSGDGAETDGSAANDDSHGVLSLCFVEHGVGIVGDKVTGREDVGGEKHDLVWYLGRDGVEGGVSERNEDVLGLCTIERHGTKDARLGATTSLVAVAEEAVATRNGEGRNDLVTLFPVLDAVASLVDLADKLVTENKVILGDGLVTTVDVQIRTAEGGKVDLDDDFTRARFRDGTFEHGNLFRALDDDSLHGGGGGHDGEFEGGVKLVMLMGRGLAEKLDWRFRDLICRVGGGKMGKMKVDQELHGPFGMDTRRMSCGLMSASRQFPAKPTERRCSFA